MATNSLHKAELARFLAQNPFEDPLTLGMFYREKMRAIHRIAPDAPFRQVLEVGGGRSGLTALLYPKSLVINLDSDPDYAKEAVNLKDTVRFVCGDATALPFSDRSFDAVTLFDVIEHIDDDDEAAAEVGRVIKPGGYVLLSTPCEHWRYPRYRSMRSICPSQPELMAEWGHVRTGYALGKLNEMFPGDQVAHAGFINRITAVNHDLAFSRLPRRVRKLLGILLIPPTWYGYLLGAGDASNSEVAVAWRVPDMSEPRQDHPMQDDR